MSAVRLQRRLAFGLLSLWAKLLGCLLLAVVIPLVLGLMLGLYRSQNLGLRSQYIHSFSIVGDL